MGSSDFLLGNYVSDRLTTSIFPTSDAEAAGSPFVKSPYHPALHLAVGNLKQFDTTKNGAPGTLPYSDFNSSTGKILQGAAMLDVYGPMWFVILREVLIKLLPDLGEAFCEATTADAIKAVMHRHVLWCASSCAKFVISYVTYRFLQDEPFVGNCKENIPHELAVV
jgi:hypothetical protein